MYDVYKEAKMTQRKQIRQKDKRTGRIYVYETEYRYDKSKKRTVPHGRKLVGHVDPITGEVVPNRETKPYTSSPGTRREFFGATYLFDHICEVTGVAGDIAKAAPSIAVETLSIAYYLAGEDSSPIYRFGRWARTHTHPCGYEITSQRGSEILASLDLGIKERFCRLQAMRRDEKEYWFYDTTSISSYSETLRQVKLGHNKDLVPLPQINLAVLVGQRTGLPFHFRHVAGNIADVSTVLKLIDDVSAMDAGKVRVACDRGFWSAKNINAMMDAHTKFLIGTKTSLSFVDKAIREHSRSLRSWRNFDNAKDVFGMTVPHEWAYEKTHARSGKVERAKRRSYLHLYYSIERSAEDERRLSALLRQLSAELEGGNRIEAHEGLYERYFRKERGRYEGRMDVIEAEQAKYGYFALFGNDASLSAMDALAVYREKDMIEKCFADVKNRLDFRTPKVSSPETLSGKLLCVFISLIILSWLKRAMSQSGLDEKWTIPTLIDELDTIERYCRPGKKPKVLEITNKQKDIYAALGVNVPA
jgi:transposase